MTASSQKHTSPVFGAIVLRGWLCFAVGAAVAWSRAPAATDLTPEQHRTLNQLLAAFGKGSAQPAEQIKAARAVLAIGGPGPSRLLGPLTGKYRSRLGAYESELRSRAIRVRMDKTKKAAADEGKTPQQLMREISATRRTVLDLQKNKQLTAKDIAAKGKPAMIRLTSLLTIDAEAVLAESPALRARREHVLALAGLLRDCRTAADADGPKTGGSQESLRRFEQGAALAAIPMLPSSRRTLLANAGLEAQLEIEEARGIRDVNRIRLLLGLHALKIDVKLCQAARDHSKDMRTKKFFSHLSPVPGKKMPWDRAKRFGTIANAENIAFGVRTGAAANRIWFYSPAHIRNMLHVRLHRIGMGQYEGVWTQLFGV